VEGITGVLALADEFPDLPPRYLRGRLLATRGEGQCRQPDCVGAPAGNGLCFGHLPTSDVARFAKKQRGTKGGLDLQRTDIDSALVASISEALGSNWGKCDFGLARFARMVSFEGITFGPSTTFFGSVFGDQVSFSTATFGGDIDFRSAWFEGEADLVLVRVEGDVDLSSASFQKAGIQFVTSNRGMAYPHPVWRLNLNGTTFGGRTRIDWYTAPVEISMERTVFLDSFLLMAIGTLKAIGVDIGRSSRIVSFFAMKERLSVLSLDDMDLDLLTLSGVDMSEFRSPAASDLSRLHLEGDTQFRFHRKGLQTSRKVLKQEFDTITETPGGASAMASLYRAIRKATEDAKDFAGASDFYYGEMQMRRRSLHGATSLSQLSERALLGGYWAFGGYGVRPLRPFAVLLILIVASAVGFRWFGLVADVSTGTAVRQAVLVAFSFLRPPGDVLPLSTGGFYMAIFVRCLSPVLIALGILGLRSRVRR
jgi:hypothetical protein